ncbi:MAG: YdcH family protein [Hyphomonadaceae bacterium]
MELREEHRALDSAIAALQEKSGGDTLQLARLKRSKLVLKDQIQWIEDKLTPDIIA